MKSKAAVLWFFLSLALAVLLVLQWNAGRKQRVILEKVQLQLEKHIQAEKTAESKVEELENERRELTSGLRAAEFELNNARLAHSMALQMTNLPRAQASGPMQTAQSTQSGGAAMRGMLANMFKDPEMRKALEQQQRMGLEMIYGSLFKQLQLSPEQEKSLKELLLEQQMAGMAHADKMFGDNPEERKAMLQQVSDEQKARQEQIKEILGQEKFAQYENYNQTVGERMTFEHLGRQADLSPAQTEQLLAIVGEEKKNVQVNRGAPDFNPQQDWQKAMEGEAMEQFLSQQEEVYSRVLDRAGQVLTPEQLQKLGPLLDNQLQMQRAGMKMARQMMGAQDNQVAEPPPPLPTVQP